MIAACGDALLVDLELISGLAILRDGEYPRELTLFSLVYGDKQR